MPTLNETKKNRTSKRAQLDQIAKSTATVPANSPAPARKTTRAAAKANPAPQAQASAEPAPQAQASAEPTPQAQASAEPAPQAPPPASSSDDDMAPETCNDSKQMSYKRVRFHHYNRRTKTGSVFVGYVENDKTPKGSGGPKYASPQKRRLSSSSSEAEVPPDVDPLEFLKQSLFGTPSQTHTESFRSLVQKCLDAPVFSLGPRLRKLKRKQAKAQAKAQETKSDNHDDGDAKSEDENEVPCTYLRNPVQISSKNDRDSSSLWINREDDDASDADEVNKEVKAQTGEEILAGAGEAGEADEEALAEAGKAGEEALDEAGKAGEADEGALAEAGKAGEEAPDEAGKAGEEAPDEAGKAGEEALAEAGEAGEEALKDAGEEALDEAGKAGEEALKDAGEEAGTAGEEAGTAGEEAGTAGEEAGTASDEALDTDKEAGEEADEEDEVPKEADNKLSWVPMGLRYFPQLEYSPDHPCNPMNCISSYYGDVKMVYNAPNIMKTAGQQSLPLFANSLDEFLNHQLNLTKGQPITEEHLRQLVKDKDGPLLPFLPFLLPFFRVTKSVASATWELNFAVHVFIKRPGMSIQDDRRHKLTMCCGRSRLKADVFAFVFCTETQMFSACLASDTANYNLNEHVDDHYLSFRWGYSPLLSSGFVPSLDDPFPSVWKCLKAE